MIQIKHDFASLMSSMTDKQKKQIPFATSLAINRTAQKVRQAQVKEMRDIFNRPTLYILNSVFIKPSTKSNLVAIIGIKDQAFNGAPASKILTAEIAGGSRRYKKFEKALRSVGALPDGYYIVPGEAASMDAYGNVSRGQIVQILSYFKAFPEAGYKANSTDASRARLKRGTKTKMGVSYFVGRPGDGRSQFGIWQRIHSGFGKAIRPVFIFVTHTQYQAIYDFKYVSGLIIKREYPIEFNVAFNQAMRTAI